MFSIQVNLKPSFVALGHEMAHTQDYYMRGKKAAETEWLNIDGTIAYDSEKYATHVENMIRAENRLDLRTHYLINPDGSAYEPSTLFSPAGGSLFFNETFRYDISNDPVLNPYLEQQWLEIIAPFSY